MSRTRTADCTAQQQDEWLTPREVAQMTKLSEQTLANHRSQKIGIPYTKLSEGRAGRVRYRLSDVHSYLSGQAAA
ncbi:helix-turn-helix transcriptional regulator [Streptomyces sp. UG1]|uniref:helix-turn-helix transcriptional regulator n=1 Tax=Streptomyces sp. UG1 TaxID=3417652 RepID=UPI003CF779E8